MRDCLTEADKKHWHPTAALTAWLVGQIPPDARVLDVGAGILPFPRANVLVDAAQPNVGPEQQVVNCDFVTNPLPFPDKSFDFVYCRHVVEDLYNPFPLIREIERVGHAGYIETPSPLAEVCPGIDGASPPWRGYYHHHYIVWPHQGELRFVAKYPLIEYLDFSKIEIAPRLRQSPHLWNTHYLWKNTIKVSHRQNVVDFHLFNDYGHIIGAAIEQGRISCDEFWQDIPKETRIPQLGLNRPAA
jgi:hypothetical protein